MSVISRSILAIVLVSGLSVLSGILYNLLSAPAWENALINYIFPAFYGISNIPVLDTLFDILWWTAVFEILYFMTKLSLKFIQWLQLSGDSFLD